MTGAPCKNCADRAVGCHGVCKQYNDWAVLHKREVANEKANSHRSICQPDYIGPGKKRYKRKQY